MSYTREKAVAGVTAGVIERDQEVEWRARHFGLWLSMRVRITALDRPNYFRDEMVRGPFRCFQHDHTFTQEGSSTLMHDNLRFESPFSLLGRTFDKLVLQAHLLRLLENRNRTLKSLAESDKWHKYLSFPRS